MSAFVIDSSAFIAILNVEDESERFKRFIDQNREVLVSVATLHEMFCVVVGTRFPDGSARLQELIELIDPATFAFDMQQLNAARQAYARYGRGSGHRAKLNMGDCFSYALARTRNLPLLFKGDDFIHTDIEPALRPA